MSGVSTTPTYSVVTTRLAKLHRRDVAAAVTCRAKRLFEQLALARVDGAAPLERRTEARFDLRCADRAFARRRTSGLCVVREVCSRRTLLYAGVGRRERRQRRVAWHDADIEGREDVVGRAARRTSILG